MLRKIIFRSAQYRNCNVARVTQRRLALVTAIMLALLIAPEFRAGRLRKDRLVLPQTGAVVPPMSDYATFIFRCQSCDAEYRVVRIEAPPTHDRQLTCLSCGGPLNNREGKLALKYFRISDGREPGRMNGRKPKF